MTKPSQPILIVVGANHADGSIERRLYAATCVFCGSHTETEAEGHEQLECAQCGGGVFRHMRNEELQVALVEQHQVSHDTGGMMHA